MPIRPEMKSKYPPRKEWLALRESILARAGQRCEFCGVPNYAEIVRHQGTDYTLVGGFASAVVDIGCKVVTVILTIAHLDQDPTHNDPGNLRALCQRCHNRHDAPHRARNAAATRARKKRPSQPEVARG